ncbi:MAG: M17 family metallopeptidase, partial [Phycisphaerae bacterium]
IAHTACANGPFRRVIIVSLGTAAELTAARIRQAGAEIARWLINEKVERAALAIDDLISAPPDDAVGPIAHGMTLAGWQYDKHLADDKRRIPLIRITLLAHDAGQIKRVMSNIRDAQTIADAANYARRLAHEPANIINPATLTAEAKKLASNRKLKLTVVNAAKAKELNMNGLLNVGKAGSKPPCLLVLEYRPLPKSRSTTVLIGKTITFDTGGYSLKPAAAMTTMKYDKCGGTTVLGILDAVAALGLPCNVVGVLAVAENSITGDAYKPDDIITMANGKTVEIANTDAEGRLVLADALWYAQEFLKPTRMIDYATLTGGVLVALGVACAGLMSNDEQLADALTESGRVTHERLWPLPIWDDYFPLIKSNDADMKNSSTKRQAHATVGGIFLKQFVNPEVPWAHLDIAGTASDDDGNPLTGVGATGFGVNLTVEYLRRHVC